VQVFRTFDQAAANATHRAIAAGVTMHLDVVILSKAGARWYGGDDAAKQYDEDPEASVFERIVVTATSLGRQAPCRMC